MKTIYTEVCAFGWGDAAFNGQNFHYIGQVFIK